MKSSRKSESAQKKDNLGIIQTEAQDLLEKIKNLSKHSSESNKISSLAYDAYSIDRFWGGGEKRILLEGGSCSSSRELLLPKSQSQENLNSMSTAEERQGVVLCEAMENFNQMLEPSGGSHNSIAFLVSL